jgi:hypothetical protein
MGIQISGNMKISNRMIMMAEKKKRKKGFHDG